MDNRELTPPTVGAARHIVSRLMAESLMDRAVLSQTDLRAVLPLLPTSQVVKIGGHSIIDRGRTALLPVVEELGRAAADHHLLISVGEGKRADHVYAIATDLGLPTGLLAILGDLSTEQNTDIVAALMMQYGAVKVPIGLVPIFLNGGFPVVLSGMAPYHWWAHPPREGSIPEHRSDAGSFLTAETFGCRSMIYIKDVDGLFTADPKTNDDATLIPRITVRELLREPLPSLPVEMSVIEMLQNAKQMRRVQIINGLAPATITRALNGESVGTIIEADS